jgi:fatty-acyl-CoA synthase
MGDHTNSLDRNKANFEPLSPVSFLERTASVYPERISVIYNDKVFTWRETYNRCFRLAAALQGAGLKCGDVIGFMAANTPELYEGHFGVPMAGMVLNALNCRLDPKTIAYIIDHSEIKLLVTDKEFSSTILEALKITKTNPMIVDIDDEYIDHGELIGETDYEKFIKRENKEFKIFKPKNEWDSISINYTSGTTGKPKGVVYHYRGAYLNAIGNTLEWNMESHPIYLWTLPMFHCNGWCFPWTIAAKAGTNICIRKVTSKSIYDALADHGVNYLCGAPIILGLMVNAEIQEKRTFDQTCKVMTAAAPPPAKVLQSMQEMGFDVTHVYGLTEVYGPCVVSNWKDEWSLLDIKEQANLKARQGNAYIVQEGLRVVNVGTMKDVSKDGKTIGEVILRGNIMMKGYLKNAFATKEAFKNDWFHTGDLGVLYPDGYLQLKDRAKDIIISGGENISSIEIEDCLYLLESIASCGVVAKADEKWGEVPCAFIEFKSGMNVTKDELIEHCRRNLAGFKIPKEFIFQLIPKTSTGKIQKSELRKVVQFAN